MTVTDGGKLSLDLRALQSSKSYKIGVMLCQSGQATEEEMYNNGECLLSALTKGLLHQFIS